TYEDKGFIAEFFAAAGISSTADANAFNAMMGTEYAVRAISLNPNRQAGVSDLSAGTAANSEIRDVTASIKTSVVSPSFASGVWEQDFTVKNNGVASP